MARALLVLANPDPESLTHSLARALGESLAETLGGHAVEVADLAREGFDPSYTLADRRSYREGAELPPDVLREHERVNRATDLVLIFPIYWWSMPALLKGWIDRVFVTGWAFEDVDGAGLRPKLGSLRVHVAATAGDRMSTYDRHGYSRALETQLFHGVFDYCGMRRGCAEFIHESDRNDRSTIGQELNRAVAALKSSIVDS